MKEINGRTIQVLSKKFIEHMDKVISLDAPPWKITSPSDIGDIPEWREFNFMRFWSYFLYGITPDDAERFETEVLTSMIETKEIDADLINSTPLDQENQTKKFLAELKWANVFIKYVQEHNLETKPVARVYAMPNHLNSVGSNVEKYLAMMGDIPVNEVFINSGSQEMNPEYYQTVMHMIYDVSTDQNNHLEFSNGLFCSVVDHDRAFGLFYIKPFGWNDFGRRPELPTSLKAALSPQE